MTDHESKRIAAIVMASGFSRRMGRNKLFLPLDEGVVIERVLDQIGKIGYVAVVVVSQYDQVLAYARERGFWPVANDRAADGKSSSIRLGVETLESLAGNGEIDPPAGIAFFTGDQLLLSDQLLRVLKETFSAHPDRIIFPAYDGKPGSPAIFPIDMVFRLKRLEGEEGGMKAAFEQEERILAVPAEPSWQGMDFDTLEEWEKVKEIRTIADRSEKT